MSRQPRLIDRALTKLVIHHPFYATIAMSMELKLVPGAELRQMSGGSTDIAATDGSTIWLGQEKFDAMPLDEAVGVLQHECEHIARGHHFRMGDRDPGVWNHACDGIINHSIRTSGGVLPKGGVDMPPAMVQGQSEEQVYNMLPPPQQNPQGGGGKGQGGGRGKSKGAPPPPGNGSPHDALVKPKDTSTAAKAQHKQMVAKAAAVAKAQGKLPRDMARLVEELLNPSVDWHEALRQFLTEVNNSDYSWQRFNRRYLTDGIYLPGIAGEGRAGKLGFVFDTSGSCFAEIEQYLGELVSAVEDCNPSRLVVAYCDARVQHADEFDEPSEAEVADTVKVYGGGGTSMPAGLKWFARNHDDVQAVIVLTDGYTDWGDEEDYPFPVLWAVTSERVPLWGQHVKVTLERG